jgi:hypothetical protein
MGINVKQSLDDRVRMLKFSELRRIDNIVRVQSATIRRCVGGKITRKQRWPNESLVVIRRQEGCVSNSHRGSFDSENSS